MDRATFFKHYDLLADQPEAVAKMRELILQLAVEGRLIPQDSKDRPASELLELSAAQQKRLVKEGATKAYEAPPVESAEKFIGTTPKGWVWVRLKELGHFCVGATPSMNKSAYWGDGIPWVTPKDMRTLRIRGSEMSVTPLALKETRLRLLPKNSVLIVGRSGILKRLLPVAVTEIECVVNQDMKVLVPFLPELASFIQLMLRGHQAFILERLVKGGMTVQSLKYDEFEAQPFPLPPLGEQRRIVAKVDELMALCDDLEQQQRAQHDAATLFHRSALHHLVTARDQATFTTGWHRVSGHFHWLHDSPDSITQLRQAILQLAVKGRLGTQDRKDEPAKKLIEQARDQWPECKISERQNWKPEEPPCELPAGWEWTCLDVLGNTNPKNEADEKMEVAFTPMRFISAEYGRPAVFEIRPWGEVKKGFTHFANNDVVLAKITPCFENGKSAVMRGLKNGIGAGTTELHVFRRYDDCVLPDYVLLFFKTSHFIETGVPRMTGSAGQKRVSWEYFANSPFPLPPMAEQKRIVTMVNDLTQQCDALELQLNDSRTLGTQLLDSTIHHLFVKPEESELAASSGGRKK